MTDGVELVEGDCRDAMAAMGAASVDSVVTDPPYGLEFMGVAWDTMRAKGKSRPRNEWGDFGSREHARTGEEKGRMQRNKNLSFGEFSSAWATAALRVLKPGGYMACFGGARTYHRLACAVEDAGFEVRDCVMWLYGSGLPKGRGCLKPAYEPILLCRRPGPRVLPLGIDECRVEGPVDAYATPGTGKVGAGGIYGDYAGEPRANGDRHPESVRHHAAGRWPANVVHSGDPEVLAAFAEFGEKASGGRTRGGRTVGLRGNEWDRPCHNPVAADSGTAARFFYTAKASKKERGEGNTHPTVKPLALVRWLVRLACPPGGRLLDPFAGSGTTGLAARAEGRRAVLVERDPGYCEIIRRRLSEVES